MRQRDLEKTLTDQMATAQGNITRGTEALAKEQARLDGFRAVFSALQDLLDKVRGTKKPKAPKKPKGLSAAAADLAGQKPGSPERPL